MNDTVYVSFCSQLLRVFKYSIRYLLSWMLLYSKFRFATNTYSVESENFARQHKSMLG